MCLEKDSLTHLIMPSNVACSTSVMSKPHHSPTVGLVEPSLTPDVLDKPLEHCLQVFQALLVHLILDVIGAMYLVVDSWIVSIFGWTVVPSARMCVSHFWS